MPRAQAFDIVIKALTLRTEQPHLTALDVLDQVMRGHHGPIEFGDLAAPPAPFALLVSEAFEPVIGPNEWAGLMSPQNGPRARDAFLEIWADEVWPLFRTRYGLF